MGSKGNLDRSFLIEDIDNALHARLPNGNIEAGVCKCTHVSGNTETNNVVVKWI